ncbi:hypothetical protein [Prosthecobacter sp.]|uniref:hypothetical protein n=1 Tax=Prosthecobacter sp. TaxID=1965333 RepID=UPI003784B2A1
MRYKFCLVVKNGSVVIKRNMHHKTVFLGMLFLTHGAMVTAADADLERLKQSYQEATSRALAPLNATYEKELLKLLEQRTKAGQLAEAIEVKEEIERITGRAIKDTSGTPAQPGRPPLEKLFVGKSWRTSLGTVFEFKKDGSGSRQLGSDKKAIVSGRWPDLIWWRPAVRRTTPVLSRPGFSNSSTKMKVTSEAAGIKSMASSSAISPAPGQSLKPDAGG